MLFRDIDANCKVFFFSQRTVEKDDKIVETNCFRAKIRFERNRNRVKYYELT